MSILCPDGTCTDLLYPAKTACLPDRSPPDVDGCPALSVEYSRPFLPLALLTWADLKLSSDWKQLSLWVMHPCCCAPTEPTHPYSPYRFLYSLLFLVSSIVACGPLWLNFWLGLYSSA